MIAGPRLELRNLAGQAGGRVLFRDVSLLIDSGECVVLAGENGAGKTTLLDIIDGVHRPVAGQVLLHGTNLRNEPPWRRARRGMLRLYQDGGTFVGLSVAEALNLAPRARGASMGSHSQVSDLLERLAIDVTPNQLCGTLSVGQKRLLGVASILSAGPTVLLLDEPAAGLSQVAKLGLANVLLQESSKRGCALLVVEHDRGFVEALGARRLLLANGTLTSA